ncbi:hypothetical protein [Shinella zoogloeoides]|uniref:hypothetical protein n=1 Tax=Shinella zoogloeoides TaxID=352475 RepID=UPI0028AA9CC3|nr:hypothetical protein [Shinella zoogloeoides]
MTNNFHRGQLVECIDDRPGPVADPEAIPEMNGLTRGRIYTVRWAGPALHMGKTFNGIRLDEILRDDGDLPFFAHRFRPVRPERQAIFQTLLRVVTEDA